MLEYPRLAHDARYRRITARMVLSHGTGLPNWGGETLAVGFEPGTAYGYSGEGFLYLQKVVERVTGRSLDELARQEVFEPLGMTRSGYVWHDRFAGHAAYARDWLWNVATVNHYTDGEANAAASLLTTAPDYARFVAAVMTGPRTLARDVEDVPHARPRDEPGHLDGARRSGRGRDRRPHLLPQRQQRPALHLLHDG